MSIYVPGKVVLRQTWQPMDPDAAAYIAAVEAADTTAGSPGGLEEKVKIAIDNFVLGCKADGIWSAIKASCILAGARTLDGCLVPLVGTAPTSYNFVAGDYNRETGLKGNGSTKYLNSNRNNNADPQDNCHVSCYRTRSADANQAFVAARAGGVVTGAKFLWTTLTPRFTCNPSTDVHDFAGNDTLNVATFQGVSRSSNSTTTGRINGASYTFTRSSAAPISNNLRVFCSANDATQELFSSARLAFYSIGEALDLALLDTRVTALIAAIGAAIP